MNKPNNEQAQAAFSIVDRAVSQLDCKGLSLMQARDLITALQVLASYLAPVAAPAVAPAEAPPAP